MRFRSTIIVLIIAVLGVVAALRTARSDGDALAGESSRRTLLTPANFPGDEIDRIELRREGEAPLVYARDAGGWRQIEPFPHPVDQYSIHQLIAQATRLEITERFDGDEQTLSGLALDPPKATVTYSWGDESLQIDFGRLGLAGQAYLRLRDGSGDEPVYVVGQQLHDRALKWDPKEWRERRLFQDVGIDSDTVVRTAQGWPTLTLQRDRRTWSMIEPMKTRLDSAARDQLMQAVGNAMSTGFIEDQPRDLAQYGLADPQASLTITTVRREMVNGQPRPMEDVQRLLIGIRIGTSEDRYGMIEGRPTVVQVPAAALARLLPAPEMLAAKPASGVNPADVKRIVIRTADQDVTLERELERWLAPEVGGGAEVPAGAVNELLDQLTALQATEIVFETYPADQEVATVTLYGFDLRAIDTVRIARAPDEEDGQPGRWIFENGDGVLRYHPASLQPLLTPPAFGLSQ